MESLKIYWIITANCNRNMDINSKIKWTPGMVLSSRLLNSLNRHYEHRNILTIKALLGDIFGVVPGAEMSAAGFFVKGNLEIPSLRCTAILPSGRYVSVDESVVFSVPKLDAGTHYFCVGIGKDELEFECDGILMTRPVYEYGILDFETLRQSDMFPILRLLVSDGVCSIDEGYIAPCLNTSDNGRILELCSAIADVLDAVASHVNMDEAHGKFMFLRYGVFLHRTMKDYSVSRLMQRIRGLADVLDDFVFSPNDRHEDIPELSYFDMEKWLLWMLDYVRRAGEILDSLATEKNELDIDALVAQIEAAVTGTLKPQLTEILASELREVLLREMEAGINDKLKDFLDGTFSARTHDTLKEELGNELNPALYGSLYKALYDALFVPSMEEDDNYVPLI